jgi:NADH-quinone oxidoreductase subunit L
VNAVYVILAAPLLGAIILLFGGRTIGQPLSGILATTLSSAAFVATVVVWITLLGRSVGPAGTGRSVDKTIFTWIPVDYLHVSFGLQADQLSIMMCLFVTGVGSLIHLYSIGYMKGDPSFPRFFFLLNLFLFSMVTLVLADNFLFSFLGWEGVGFCSYGLVGFWFDRETAAVAAKKAFVTNRVGDFGFMIALFLMYGHFHSFSYSVVLAPLIAGHATLATVTATGLGLMIFLGAAGKSAQIPLYMWLPDAMEGPTPVSALIHAATMVTAGVYLVARAAPIIHFSHTSQLTIACIGAATALFAATIACAQNDIKRVLAYSTLSQLGYMFLAEGSGNYEAGLFHMVTHAFFKALLFLAAGSVIHALHDEQNMKKMGKSEEIPSHNVPGVQRRVSGPLRYPPVRRLLVEGRHPRRRVALQQRPLGHRGLHRRSDGVLHEPPGRPGLLRSGPVERAGQHRSVDRGPGGPRNRFGRGRRQRHP